MFTNLKYSIYLFKRNYLVGIFCKDKYLKEEKKMNMRHNIKSVGFHGYGKNNKYKNKIEACCYSILKDDGCYHSFVSYPKKKYRQRK